MISIIDARGCRPRASRQGSRWDASGSPVVSLTMATTTEKGRRTRIVEGSHLLHPQKRVARPSQVADEFASHIDDQGRDQQRQRLSELIDMTMLS